MWYSHNNPIDISRFPFRKFSFMCDVMASVLASSAVDRGFEPRPGETIDYKIGIYCYDFMINTGYTSFR